MEEKIQDLADKEAQHLEEEIPRLTQKELEKEVRELAQKELSFKANAQKLEQGTRKEHHHETKVQQLEVVEESTKKEHFYVG